MSDAEIGRFQQGGHRVLQRGDYVILKHVDPLWPHMQADPQLQRYLRIGVEFEILDQHGGSAEDLGQVERRLARAHARLRERALRRLRAAARPTGSDVGQAAPHRPTTGRARGRRSPRRARSRGGPSSDGSPPSPPPSESRDQDGAGIIWGSDEDQGRTAESGRCPSVESRQGKEYRDLGHRQTGHHDDALDGSSTPAAGATYVCVGSPADQEQARARLFAILSRLSSPRRGT